MESCLFEGVRYFLAEDVENAAEVKSILKEGGGMREFYLNELVTHIIAESPPDPSTLPLSDVVIVKADWVIMSKKCGALLPYKAFEPMSDKLFSNVIFCCSKLSCSDMEKLVVLTMFYGGKMQRMLDSSVTHLVTMEASGAKYECAQKHSDVMKVVTPDWVLDSIDAGKRQDEALYHPTCLKLKGSHHVRGSRSSPSSSVQKCNGDNGMAASKERREGEEDGHNESSFTVSGGTELDDGGNKEDSRTTQHTGDQPMSEDPSPTGGSEEVKVGVKSESTFSANLLDGMAVLFTDYQDCMDDETMDKWKQVVKQNGGRVLNRYDPNQCTHLLALHKRSTTFSKALSDGKCIASAHWLNDVLTEQKMFPPSNPLHFPTAFQWQLPEAEKYSMSLTNYVGVEREIVKDMFRITGISFTGHLSRENTHLICKRPEGKKYEKALEWGIQVVNSTFLAEIIHNGREPAVLFPRHTKLGQAEEFTSSCCFEATRLLRSWEGFMSEYTERHPSLVDEATTRAVLDSLPPSSPTESTKRERSIADDLPVETKKPRVESDSTERREDKPVTVLFTGISQSVVKNLKQVILRFGGQLTDNGRECTHIVSPRITRTVKFLSGISVCRHVVSPTWVEECGKQGRWVEETPFTLQDRDAEEMFDMSVADSLSRARKKKLLTGLFFHATENVQPSFAHLKEIIECAGGVLWAEADLANRSLNSLRSRNFIVISSLEDVSAGLCSDFFKHDIPVYNAELVLTGVLRQMLDLNSNQLSPPA